MKVIVLSILLLPLWGTLNAQKLSPQQIKSLDQIVADNVDEGAPGLAMGIIRNGKVVYQKYAGVSNLDPVTIIDEDTRFNIASLAKQFTALCILRLVEERKLTLDDDIRQYIPQLYPEIKSPITIAHLLNHSSGVRDMNSLWSLQGVTWWKETFSNQDAIDLLAQQQDLNFEPGSRHVYSNSNFILLTEVVKVVSGQTFKAYSDQMFVDLGMKDTRFEPQHDQIENMALPYFNWDSWETYDWLSDLHGDGALFTTLDDQLLWEKILQKRKSKILSRELIEMSQNLIPDSEIDNYGFGLSFGDYQGLPYKYHEGATGAWHATTLRFESENLSIFITSNSGRVATDYWARRCADILIDTDKFTSVGISLSPE
ncbi:MAG: serine hydrolase domain-containing protein, partial [Bacteroidota bacterium]